MTLSCHFLDTAQTYEALDFLKNRGDIQSKAFVTIKDALKAVGVQATGTFIIDIDLPKQLKETLQERTIAEEDVLTHQAYESVDRARRARARAEAEHDAELEHIKNWSQADQIQQISNILGIQGYIDMERIRQLPNIKLPNTLVGNDGFFGQLLALREMDKSQPLHVTQEQISAFMSALGGYLKEGGAEKVREAFSELASPKQSPRTEEPEEPLLIEEPGSSDRPTKKPSTRSGTKCPNCGARNFTGNPRCSKCNEPL